MPGITHTHTYQTKSDRLLAPTTGPPATMMMKWMAMQANIFCSYTIRTLGGSYTNTHHIERDALDVNKYMLLLSFLLSSFKLTLLLLRCCCWPFRKIAPPLTSTHNLALMPTNYCLIVVVFIRSNEQRVCTFIRQDFFVETHQIGVDPFCLIPTFHYLLFLCIAICLRCGISSLPLATHKFPCWNAQLYLFSMWSLWLSEWGKKQWTVR